MPSGTMREAMTASAASLGSISGASLSVAAGSPQAARVNTMHSARASDRSFLILFYLSFLNFAGECWGSAGISGSGKTKSPEPTLCEGSGQCKRRFIR